MSVKKIDLHAVVSEWYDPLYRFAISLCRNEETALDLTQNAFHKLAQKQEEIREASKVKSWLFSVVYRDFVDGYRRGNRYPTTSLDVVAEPSDSVAGHPGERSHDAGVMLRMLGELDENFRAPLTLFYMEHLSYKEIAAVLEIPIGTVMSRLRRAKDQLRARMESVASQPNLISFPKEIRHG